MTISEGVESIGYGAFHKCDGMTTVTLPASVTAIGRYAFSSCNSLESVTFAGTEEQWNDVNKDGYYWAYNSNVTVNCTENA